ncbi:MAG: DNA methylase [bacterium]
MDREVTAWGIEHNEKGWRADAYLYCVEVRDPESGWMIPLAPSWVIGEKTRTIAKLVPDKKNKRYQIEIHEGVSAAEMEAVRQAGTVKDSRLVPQDGSQPTPIEVIRRNLRLWENDDLVPRPDDVFQERLYCIRWVETYVDKNGKTHTRRHYCAPTEADLQREAKVLKLLRKCFHEWQSKGYIPSQRIEPGYNTDQPIRERGWTHWHHLFTPRQLLIHGLFSSYIWDERLTKKQRIGSLFIIGRIADWDSRLARWIADATKENGAQTFNNQALNTLYNYYGRPLSLLSTTVLARINHARVHSESLVEPLDARHITVDSEIWLTDPPYADAINYHELGEFFLSWYEKHLPKLFPKWYNDSKRALAIKGDDPITFRKSMGDCYKRLTDHMPSNGLQVVMFTHQDATVWADLTMILWAAGLRVTAAWCIATETDSALKKGNYVQGTVLLVLRKRTAAEPVFLDEIAPKVEAEVKRQLDAMLTVEDESDPNFGDADYQLAAYAAALRVLTERPIQEIDPSQEILRERAKGEISPVEQLIRNAVKIACDHLVPRGISHDVWKSLAAMERFYLKGLEVESHGEYRNGVYQELARGFGATDYQDLLASTKANQTRLKTASAFERRLLSGNGFSGSLVRQALFAIHQTRKSEKTLEGLNWLKTELSDYWGQREKIVHILDYLTTLGKVSTMAHWQKDAEASGLLTGTVRNDHV